MPRTRPDSGPLRKTTVDMDLNDLVRLDRMARAREISRQALIRQILRDWIRLRERVR
jgi:predicted transcriptional regulator